MRSLLFIIALLALLCAGNLTTPQLVAADTLTSSPTPSPTPTMCPSATAEPLWVEPVISPTGLLTQTITVRIGNGEAVMEMARLIKSPDELLAMRRAIVACTATGSFGVYGAPALLPIDLLPDMTHHLQVQARVRTVYQWGCKYGGYTLSTSWDRYGAPLVIEQVRATATPRPRLYLPLILRGA